MDEQTPTVDAVATGGVSPLDSALGKLRGQPVDAAPDLSVLDDTELDTVLGVMRQAPSQEPGLLGQIASGAKTLAEHAASPSVSFPMVGGVAGAMSPILGGSALGTGVGSVIGNTVEAVAEGRPISASELGTRAAIDVGSDLAGGAIMKFAPRLYRGILGKKVRGAGMANDLLTTAARDTKQQLLDAGHPEEVAERLTRQFLLPHQTTMGAIPDVAANVSRNSVAGVGIGLDAVEKAQNRVFAELPDTIANRVAPLLPKEQVEDALLASIDNAAKAEKDRLGNVYTFIAKRMRTERSPANLPAGGLGDTPLQTISDRLYLPETMGAGDAGLVDLTKVKAALARQREAAEELGNPLSEGVTTLINKINRLPDKASFEAVKEFRSELLDEMRPTAEGVTPKMKFIGAASEVEGELNGALDNAVRAYDDAMERLGDIQRHQKLAPMLKKADTEFADLHQKANRQMVRGWIKAADKNLDVGKAMKAIFQGGNTKRVKLVRDIVGKDSSEWRAVRSWQINDMLKKASSAAPGSAQHNTVVGDTLLDMLKAEKQQLLGVHGKEGYDQLVGLGKALSLAQFRETGRGSILSSIVDASIVTLPIQAAVATATGGPAAGLAASGLTGTLVLGIKGLSRLMANEKFGKFVLGGMKAGKGTRTLSNIAKIAPRLIAELTLDDYFIMPPEGTPMSKEEIKNIRDEARRISQ